MDNVERIMKQIKDELYKLYIGNLILKKRVGKKNNRKNRKLRDIRMKNTVVDSLRRSYAERGIKANNFKLRDGILSYKLDILLPPAPQDIMVTFSVGPSEQENSGN